MAALAVSASKAANLHNDFPNISNIYIFADNAAAILAITDPKPGPAQFFAFKFHHTIKPLLDGDPNLTITVVWCPSHCDIRGNDRADELAKAATSLECQIPFSVTRANARRREKRSSLPLWLQDWRKAQKIGRYGVVNHIPPSLNPTPHFLSLKNKREDLVTSFSAVQATRTLANYSNPSYPSRPTQTTALATSTSLKLGTTYLGNAQGITTTAVS
jgi:hypothetical protein